MKAIATHLSQLIGTAIILGFFSEFFFLNEGPVHSLLDALRENPVAILTNLAELVGFYALFAYPFLIALERFDVSGWPGLILAAGLYGIAAESLVVPVVYEAPPISFGWTSLSWHTLVDVILGWLLLRLAMRGNLVLAIIVPIGMGLLWGLWASWLGAGNADALISLRDFAWFTATTSLFLGLGIWLADRRPVSAFHAGQVEILLVVLVSAALFSVTGLPFLPWPLVVAGLVGLILWALRAQAGRHGRANLTRLDRPPYPARYLALCFIPVAAIASYALVLRTDFQLPAEDVVLLILAAGTASFLWALGAALWPRPKPRAR